MKIPRAIRTRFEECREHHGDKWVGVRPVREAYMEILDALVYLLLERRLMYTYDDKKELLEESRITTTLAIEEVVKQLMDCLRALRILIPMVEDEKEWSLREGDALPPIE